jgi:phage shock protein PspC (stress-responsive transcriptional regulator)
MPASVYTLVTHLHGHLAWLALAVLLHPIVWLRPGRRIVPRVRWTARVGTALLVTVYAIGWWVYPEYRANVKPGLVFEGGLPGPDLWAAYLFESKEHLAVVAVSLAAAGLALLEGASELPSARLAVRVLFGGAVVVTLVVAVLAHLVAMTAHPGW